MFLFNNFALKPGLIADLYRQRWQVELFFKWIKQHLRIKVFFGTSENAVKTQIWTAISTDLLIAITKKRLQLDHHSLYQIRISSQISSPSSEERWDTTITDKLRGVCDTWQRDGGVPDLFARSVVDLTHSLGHLASPSRDIH